MDSFKNRKLKKVSFQKPYTIDLFGAILNKVDVFSFLHCQNNVKKEFNDSKNPTFDMLDSIICSFKVLPPQWCLPSRQEF